MNKYPVKVVKFRPGDRVRVIGKGSLDPRPWIGKEFTVTNADGYWIAVDTISTGDSEYTHQCFRQHHLEPVILFTMEDIIITYEV